MFPLLPQPPFICHWSTPPIEYFSSIACEWVPLLRTGLLAEPLKLPVTQGVLIDEITPNSPASEAGLQGGNRPVTVRDFAVCAGGDIIIAIDGNYVKDMDGLMSYLVTNTQPGDTINMMIVRGDETFEVPVTLRARPQETSPTLPNCGP